MSKVNMRGKLSPLYVGLIRQVLMILLSIVVVMIFLAISSYNPLDIIVGLGHAFGKNFAGTVRWAAPMILAGIAVCVAFKAQVFTLGVDGQIYLGAIAATWVALSMPAQSGVGGIIVTFFAAAIAGALFAMIPALLNVYLGTDMVVSTMLLNFVGQLLTEFMVAVVMRDPEKITQTNSSRVLPESLWLPKIEALGGTANVGIFIAIIVALIIAFVFYKTSLGYEIKLVGTNPNLARYGGIKPRALILKVMAISGAVSGLIGAIEVTAIQHKLIATFNPDIGFDGIVVALLANNNPIGVIVSGLFFGALKNAGSVMERVTEVPNVVSQITMAIIILTISGKVSLKLKRRKKEAHTK